MLVRIPGFQKLNSLGLEDPESVQAGIYTYLTCSIFFFVVHILLVFPFWISHTSILRSSYDGRHGQCRSLVIQMAWLYLPPNPFWCEVV